MTAQSSLVPAPVSRDAEVLRLLTEAPLTEIMDRALRRSRAHHGPVVSYSRKVFIPLTRLCRDVCGYCTFAERPAKGKRAYLDRNEVLAIVEAGRRAGCKEALFTLGDKPELRYRIASEELKALGHSSTISYLKEMCQLVLDETGLLPHVNAGIMTEEEIRDLRRVSVSQGLMLETSSRRLSERGQAHFGSPDKDPAVRLAMIEAAGQSAVPFTTGLLIGIGETREERIQSLLAIREIDERHEHIQELIIQNFRAKPDTRMRDAEEPGLADHLWTIAAARLLFRPDMNIQAPPNLRSGHDLAELLAAGINDWGGVSPVTPDHVNPEAPWPEITRLAAGTAQSGAVLSERLAIYPEYALAPARWVDTGLHKRVLVATDSLGFAREGSWAPGQGTEIPADGPAPALGKAGVRSFDRLLAKASAGHRLDQSELSSLFAARGASVNDICVAANEVRQRARGDHVTYVVNRNINYTNICYFRCGFCAFSKGKTAEQLRGKPYDLGLDEIVRRAVEAYDRGATEVCMQGGIHPRYTGETYLAILKAVKGAVPALHVHAFSPLEVWQGAATLGLRVEAFLEMLQEAGLGSLPGTAAEILDDSVRQIICPDKLTTGQWFEVIEAAHRIGLKTTSTIMFGHVETTESWAKHLLGIRDQQERTGGFTEFVPLPFVHMEAPMHLKAGTRTGPTWREVRLMHALARLSLNPLIPNIQTSWVKLGAVGASRCLEAGANDLGGTLMNESISRAAGTQHGQEMPPARMEEIATSIGRQPHQRSTLYGEVSRERQLSSFAAPPLEPLNLSA